MTPRLEISDPLQRAVLEDRELESGRAGTRWGVALELTADDAAAADAASAAGAAEAADSASAASAYVAADSAADAGFAADDAAAEAADADDAEAAQNLTSMLMEQIEMRNGLTVLQVTGAYYGYAVTLVGWLRRVGGDEYEMAPGYVTVRRNGDRHPNGIDRLAADGPGNNYSCSEPAKMPEQFHRLLVRRPKPCNEDAWATVCPRPKDWVDE